MTVGNGSADVPEKSNAERAWTRVLRAALAMPFVKVDRQGISSVTASPLLHGRAGKEGD